VIDSYEILNKGRAAGPYFLDSHLNMVTGEYIDIKCESDIFDEKLHVDLGDL
jgi:hypothetical protein